MTDIKILNEKNILILKVKITLRHLLTHTEQLKFIIGMK